MYTDSHEQAPAWFIVRAKPKQEGYAQSNLGMRHVPVFLPRIIELGYDGVEVSRRKPAPLFPGYLFVRLQLPDDYYRVIWTPGVRDLVSLGSGPVPVPDGAIREIRTRCDASGVVRVAPTAWRAGDRVEIPAGPFEGLVATVVTVMPSRQRIKLLIDFLARQTCVEMPLGGLQSATALRRGTRVSRSASVRL
jgi:transcriptional antiterminator RfaH